VRTVPSIRRHLRRAVKVRESEMKARIREKIYQVRNPQPRYVPHEIDVEEQYFTAAQVGKRLNISRVTVKQLMKTETVGVIRIGNTHSTTKKRAHTIERYSASAIARLIRRLERGEDPRYA
jgi:hypothetical protein